jgi:hypothetical protein
MLRTVAGMSFQDLRLVVIMGRRCRAYAARVARSNDWPATAICDRKQHRLFLLGRFDRREQK